MRKSHAAGLPETCVCATSLAFALSMTHCHTMSKAAKIAITIEPSLLQRLDRFVGTEALPNRSQAIQAAVRDQLDRLEQTRLGRECAKLDRKAEQALAEEGFTAGSESWPEY